MQNEEPIFKNNIIDSEEELKAANEREIQRIMQEELNELEAQSFQNFEN
jgi:hypothetical protein